MECLEVNDKQDPPKFEFDVAFSFHSLDESLAAQLNDRLQDRYRTFLYSEQQKILAGRNGEDTFNEVFRKKAQFVVVLFRKEWGETPFTKIEQRAIRDRAYDEGYGFTLFIPTETQPSMPPWVERTRLYLSLQRFGVDSAAAVIESKLQELGSEPVIESATQRAQRLQRSLAFKKAKNDFAQSAQGAAAGAAAYSAVLENIKSLVDELSSDTIAHLKMEQHTSWVLFGMGPWLLFNWTNRYSNVLENAALEAQFYRNQPRLPGIMTREDPIKSKLLRFPFGLLRPGFSGFTDGDREFDETSLADHILKAYLDATEHFKPRF
jgi:hypothetical protein